MALKYCKPYGQKALTLPVLILTGRDTVEDRVLGLDNGADAYLVKPFAFPELLAHDVWKVRERSTPLDNVIDVNIARLRHKVDGPNLLKLIRTIRGVGFMATATEDDHGSIQ